MIKCSLNRIDLQIVNTKTVLGAKFQPNQRNYNILPFLPLQRVKITNFSKMEQISFSNSGYFSQITTNFALLFKNGYNNFTVPNQRNYNILPFLPFWGQNYKLFKNGHRIIFKLYAQKLFWVQNFSQIRETTIFCPFCHFGVKITKCSKMDLIFKFYANENCSGYKISAKSEKLQYFDLLVSKLQNFQKS